MMLHWLSDPVEMVDAWLASGLSGTGLVVVLVLAALLGLRHATDPDHLVAVTALVTGEPGAGPRRAARLGAWWGAGHATVLLVAGGPLILADAALPAWVAATAERVIGAVIVALAVRMLWRWRRRRTTGAHTPVPGRTTHQSVALGALHGLGGTGTIVLLLATELPSATDALLALAIFAPMSVVSMTACTALYGRLLAHPRTTRAIPALALGSLAFGAWYASV